MMLIKVGDQYFVASLSPRCYLCYKNPLAIFENPNLVIDITVLNFTNTVTSVTCDQLNQAAWNGLVLSEQCTYLTTDPIAIQSHVHESVLH